jgi:hypothetical protein
MNEPFFTQTPAFPKRSSLELVGLNARSAVRRRSLPVAISVW